MTEDERRNRNPAVEISRSTLEAVERDHPKVTAAELQLHRVYVIQSAKHICTLNYMGVRPVMHPVTLDIIVAHHFHGPRANLDVYLSRRGFVKKRQANAWRKRFGFMFPRQGK